MVVEQGDTRAKRELLALLVQRIVPKRIARAQCEAAIAWTPLGQALRDAVVAARTAAGSRCLGYVLTTWPGQR
jgi:hypothetical protein